MTKALPTLIIAADHHFYKLYLRASGLNEKTCRFINRPFDLDGRDRQFIVAGPHIGPVPQLRDTARAMGFATIRERDF